MASLRWTLLLVGLTLAPAAADEPRSKPLPAAQAKAVDAAMLTEMDKQQIVGLAVGVVRDGDIVYLKGYGFADRERKEPVTSKTLFRWASCSKPVTAIAAMQLAEKGRLDLDADVRTLVPEFPGKEVITPRQLLCHQSGIVHYKNGKVVRSKSKYKKPHPFADVVVALDTFKESPLLFKPGEKMSYTTHGYILLSAAVERAGKQPFADQVRERIVKPLGLTTMQPDYQWERIAHRAVGYRKVNGKVATSTDTDVSWKLGGGGYLSNIDDFARFAQGLLMRKLVTEKSEQLMWTRQKTADGKETAFGLGFQVDSTGGKLRVAHSGSQEKTKTRMVLYPQQRHAVVVMTNSEWVNPGQLTTLVYSALAGK